ncbi:hypothetical protein [Streptomyces sp. NPDC056169]
MEFEIRADAEDRFEQQGQAGAVLIDAVHVLAHDRHGLIVVRTG